MPPPNLADNMIAPNFFQAQKAIAIPATNVNRERRSARQSWRLRSLTISAAICLLLSGWAAAGQRAALTIGITQFPATLNPNIDVMAAKSYVLGMAMRPFTVYDADWKLVCLLCTELPSIENGRAVPVELQDGRKGIDLTYTIRSDATWGDGVPVTTADVLFTYEVGRNRQSAVSNAELYRRITGIDVKDDKTFTMHLDKLTFDYAAINDFVVLPAHIERPAFADPAQYRVQTRYATDPTNPGLYNGPYRISEVATGSHLVLEPNPHWAGPPAPFRRITVRTIENTAALEANLLSGTIDMVAGELGLSLDEALAFDKRHGGAFQIIYKPGLVFEHVDLNLDLPALSDRRVRQALLWGLDREAISRSLFGGRQPVADSFVNPLDRGFSADTPRYRHDPKRAAALLDEAGWTDAIRRAARQCGGTDIVRRAEDDRRKPHARAGRAGPAEPVAQDRRRCPPEKRAGPRAVRRVAAAPPLRSGDVRLDQRPGKRAALDPAFGRDTERGQRVRGPEHARFPERRGGPADRRARNRARPGEAPGNVGRAAAPVRDRAALAAALLPLRFVHPAEMAEGRAADRKPVALDIVDHRMVGRRMMYVDPC